jgi:uncharacterized membrane protein YeaQ/YmgE (transglycosylase-associated protein family)
MKPEVALRRLELGGSKMAIVVFIIVGLIAGGLAGRLIEGHGFGMLGDVVVGIIGALVGGYIFDALGLTDYKFWSTLGTSIVGAVIFLGVMNLFPTRGSSTTYKT